MAQQTIVVKIGTSSLTDGKGMLDRDRLNGHVAAVVRLKRIGYRVILVSSGAIAAGFHDLGLDRRPVSLAAQQAAAAVGQGLLIQQYRDAFAAAGEVCAQVLLTRSDFDHRGRYLNALNTLNFLLEKGAVPVINENDSVAVDEIRWGDNDCLAARVAGLVQAEWLLLVTNTDGLYSEPPEKNPAAEKIRHLSRVDEKLILRMDGSKSPLGSGGMRSKLTAARAAARAGVRVYIGTAGTDNDWMCRAVEGWGTGTYIDRMPRRITRKEQWIAAYSSPKGRLRVDAGAVRALLEKGGSLLPCGVTEVEGRFQAGEVVEVTDPAGNRIGRGLTRYSAEWLQRVKGWQTARIRAVYPRQSDEVIHRDDWVAEAEKTTR